MADPDMQQKELMVTYFKFQIKISRVPRTLHRRSKS